MPTARPRQWRSLRRTHLCRDSGADTTNSMALGLVAVPPDQTDHLWAAYYWGGGTILALMGGGFLFLAGNIRDLWRSVGGAKIADAEGALAAERRFATKGDLDALEERMAKNSDRAETRISASLRELLREHETNIKRDVDERIRHVRARLSAGED